MALRFTRPINPFSDQFQSDLDQVSESVAWWDEYRDDMARLASEPRRQPQASAEPGDRDIDAVIKTSASLGDNRWTYTCEPAEWDATGKKWITLVDTTDEFTAYNRAEMLNTSSSVLHGYAVDGTNYTLTLEKIPDDTPVRLRPVPGTTAYTFSEPNKFLVECDGTGFVTDFGVIA